MPRLLTGVSTLSLLILLAACSTTSQIAKSPEAARQELEQRDIPFTADEFVKRAAEGDASTIRIFLDAGMNSNVVDGDGTTALLAAASGGQSREVSDFDWLDEIFERIMNIRRGKDSLRTLEPCKNDTLRVLLDHGANPNIPCNKDKTALMHAVLRGDIGCVNMLLTKDADTDAMDEFGMTVLMLAAFMGNEETARLLLDNGADVNKGGKFFGALEYAVIGGHPDMVKLLLKAGADVNKSTFGESVLLFAAAAGGDIETIRYLLESGASVNAKTEAGMTLLECAILFGGDVDTAKYLLDEGAKVVSAQGERDRAGVSGGFPVLYCASIRGDASLAKLLLDAGADANVRGGVDDATPLMAACENGNYELASILIDAGADVNARTEPFCFPSMFGCSADTETALILAVRKGHIKIVELLLKAGADINFKDSSGSKSTALMLASEQGHFDIVEILLHKGVDVTAKDKDGKTALSYAYKNGHVEIVQLLKDAGAEE